MRMIRAFKKIILVVFILTLSTIGIAETNVTITPKALQKGDTVGIIAPANYTPNDASYMIDYLESKGYKIVYGKSYYSKWYNFGGTDDVRADDINGFFKDKNIKAIFSIRGGYGTIRILDKLDYNLIKENPKIFSGFSDITTLLIAINEKTGLVTYHGPMSSNFKDIPEVTENSFFDAYTKPEKEYNILSYDDDYSIVNAGKSEGEITGGNLSLIVASLGTEYEINTDGKILFIEEIGEHTYRVDRMLQQLRLAGKLKNIKGIIIGDFNRVNKEAVEDMSLDEVFKENFKDLDIPIIEGVNSGHVRPFITIPIGANATIDTSKNEIIVKNIVK